MDKKIDWTKPVRFCADFCDPVRVLATYNGRAFITWGTEATAHLADCYGNVETLRGDRVENVPEELYLRVGPREDGSYVLDGAGRGSERWAGYEGKQALPLKMWQDYYKDSLEANGCFMVKVPVASNS